MFDVGLLPEDVSPALEERIFHIMDTCVPDRYPSSLTFFDKEENEFSLFWVVWDKKIEMSIPETGKIYFCLDSVGGFPALQGFYEDDDVPSDSIQELMTAYFAERREKYEAILLDS